MLPHFNTIIEDLFNLIFPLFSNAFNRRETTTLEVCKSIGIDSLEPAEWIRILKEERVESRVSYWKEKAENSDWRYKELQSENERLKAEIADLKSDLEGHYEINAGADL